LNMPLLQNLSWSVVSENLNNKYGDKYL